MTFRLSAVAGGGTKVDFLYIVGGYVPSGMAGLAPMVDSVLMQQLSRLANYLATGKPEPK